MNFMRKYFTEIKVTIDNRCFLFHIYTENKKCSELNKTELKGKKSEMASCLSPKGINRDLKGS